MALISVIIPCYNVDNLIDRLFYTLENQTIGFDNLEVILVDDCSTDDTVKKLESFEAKHPENILVVKCDENGRQGKARNIGLIYASTDYIGFLDSDDWIELDYFQKLYDIAIKGDYEVVSCEISRDYSKDITFFSNRSTQKENRELTVKSDTERKEIIMLPLLSYSSCGKLIKKQFLTTNNLFFPENVTYEDVPWGSLVHLYVTKAYILEEKLYHYYVNDCSTVLFNNSGHHLDQFTVNIWIWDQYIERGFIDRFRYELEVEHLFSFYLAAIKTLSLRFDTPNYSAYLLLRYLTLSHIPDYEANPYVQKGRFNDFYLLILTSLKDCLSKKQFLEMAENIKKIGI